MIQYESTAEAEKQTAAVKGLNGVSGKEGRWSHSVMTPALQHASTEREREKERMDWQQMGSLCTSPKITKLFFEYNCNTSVACIMYGRK